MSWNIRRGTATSAIWNVTSGQSGPLYAAATGSIRVESLFLTLPTRALTGHAIISPEG
jgi:hypothetical protein